jgi:ribosomal protein S27AE
MARRLDGAVSKATANTVTAMRRSAENRRCPKCGRKSALRFHSDEYGFGSYCRWSDCDYERIQSRH